MQSGKDSLNKTQRKLLLFDVSEVHKQWLQDLLPARFLDKCLSANHARILLNRQFHGLHGISVPNKTQLDTSQQWLLSEVTDQNELAKKIGLRICRPIIGEIVERHELSRLIEQLGEDLYSSVLTTSKLSASGVCPIQFKRHLEDENLDLFLTAVGLSALLNTVDVDDEFIRLRVKFSFPKYCWTIKPQLRELDTQALMAMLTDSVGSKNQDESHV